MAIALDTTALTVGPRAGLESQFLAAEPIPCKSNGCLPSDAWGGQGGLWNPQIELYSTVFRIRINRYELRVNFGRALGASEPLVIIILEP
jgi:hypothetical protein